jgi:hypothetical protein
MTTFFDEAYAQIWGDPSIPCVYVSIKRPLTPAEFEVVRKKQLGCVDELKKLRQELFSITDYSVCRGLTREHASEYLAKIVEREFRSGVSCKFFVRSKEKTTQDSLIHALVAAPSLNFYIYDSISEILKKITEIKVAAPQVEISANRPSIFPKFLRQLLGQHFQVKA